MPDPPETPDPRGVLTLPIGQALRRYHVRSFCISRVPEAPARFNWACEDCGTRDTAMDHYELGQQLAQHTDECTT